MINTVKKIKSLLPVLLMLIGMLMSVLKPCYAEDTVSKENKIKSVIILNFIRYTEWPENSFHSESDEINVCIYTNSEMEEAFLESNGKKINDRKINIRTIYRLKNMDECHVLYSDSLDRSQASRIFSSIRKKSILTITDQESQSSTSGIINLIKEKGKLRFQVSREQCASANLKLSSRLIKLSVNNKSK